MELAEESLMMLMYFKRKTEVSETEMSLMQSLRKVKAFPNLIVSLAN